MTASGACNAAARLNAKPVMRGEDEKRASYG
jgi:hypothetical protein